VNNSRRMRRMERHQRKPVKMEITSLMDVFTILVFFLLVNSGSVEVVEAPKTVTLPESTVQEKPRETVVIFVSPEEVLVQGKVVARVADILEAKRESLEPITARLAEVSEKVIGVSTQTVAETQEVTILADREVPFVVIKRIMTTCTSGGYNNVSLAVIQKAPPAQAG